MHVPLPNTTPRHGPVDLSESPSCHDPAVPRETQFRVTGSSKRCLQELKVLRSLPDDRRKDLPSTIWSTHDLICSPPWIRVAPCSDCVESGRARSACKFSHPPNSYQRPGVAQPSAVVWYQHLIRPLKVRRSRELHPSICTTM
jgi:hypothetical protein